MTDEEVLELIESSEALDLQRRQQLLELCQRATAASKELLAISDLAHKYASMISVTEH